MSESNVTLKQTNHQGEDFQRPRINLARLDLVSLRLVLECASRGSISAAARYCNLSVMGASQRLRRLEELFGKALFHRHRHGLELTEAGAAAVRGGRLMFAAVQQMLTEVENARLCLPSQSINSGRRGRTRRAQLPYGRAADAHSCPG